MPGLLPAIKLRVDGDRRPGRFLLTGSANLLLLPNVTESLAGRMEIVQLQPLTEAEKAHKPGGFVTALLSATLKPQMAARHGETGPTLPERLVAGGYPEPLTRSPARARQRKTAAGPGCARRLGLLPFPLPRRRGAGSWRDIPPAGG